ncbi:MAG: nucleotide exchange factor GrpE [Acetobacteraceae bacterium]|nr:nucleotide exchange factor GrpE [Acetobacteraceae bacterium]
MSDQPDTTQPANDEARQEAEQQAPDPHAHIAGLEREVAEMRDRWMRAEAEIANVRARGRREVDETRQYAIQKFARDVVEAADNIRRGIESLPPAVPGEPEIVAKLHEGLSNIERSLLAVLERNGIERIDPTGRPFDPNLHQAMAEQESPDHAPGSVMQAWTPAWTLNGRLLRPAMVVVAKAPRPVSEPAQTRLDTTA